MAKILIIDDDPDIVLATRMVLENAGYTVVAAASRDAGLEMVKDENPDMIILDVMMDSATAGFQVALSLRGPDAVPELKQIPILMVSAIHSTTPLRFGPDDDYLPVDDFVDKPIQPEQLLSKVAEYLKSAV